MVRPRWRRHDPRRADILGRAGGAPVCQARRTRCYLNVGAATSALTGAPARPTSSIGPTTPTCWRKSTGGAMVKAGGDTWYFLTADYAFGQQLQKDTTTFVEPAGGKVMGAAPYPFPGTTDFSSFLLQAQASRGEGARPVQRRRRHGELDQAGERIRPDRQDEDRSDADVHHRRARAGPRRRAGPEPDRKLLLGSQRPHARLHQAVHAEARRTTTRT